MAKSKFVEESALQQDLPAFDRETHSLSYVYVVINLLITRPLKAAFASLEWAAL